VAEYPGILAWMIVGCKEWKRIGLSPPNAVVEATEEYLQAEDSLKTWLDECCTEGPDLWTPVGDLFLSFKKWAEFHGEAAGSEKRFSQRLEAYEFKRCRRNGRRGFAGLSTTVPVLPPPPPKGEREKWQEPM
jgi:putative DNA primase/helicase